MKEIYIVDRIEGEYVVLEAPNGDILNIEKALVAIGVNEGDCLIKEANYFKIDKEETIKRKESISTMMKGMWAD
ncbi:DUF3006 domain-containing protein [Clostridium paraputrificum]|uniref:DUF3006 domain-containing protein n=1 Tax=Clostridium TaxID=1485 RepID=UPI003D32CA32